MAAWEELPPLVEGRDVAAVLANGVHVRGRVQKVLPEALEIRVQKTSHASAIPKGVNQVPKDLIAVLMVRWKRGPARALLTPTMPFGLGYLIILGLGVDTDNVGAAGGVAIYAGGGVAGYLLGNRIDTKRMRIVVRRAPPAAH